jgi:tRNA(Ile)-lysidine synthetase-like protein
MIRIIKSILPKDKVYSLSLSMGIDSVAAFHFLLSKGYRISPIHFNHGLREQNNIMEQKFFEICKKFNVNGIARKGTGLNSEAECRTARLEFYESVAENIVTAHHLNDWLESYLLNCFRGKPNHNPFEIVSTFPKFKILHPFLISRKKDFEEYVLRNKLKEFVVEDETNSINKGSRRNWIRNFLIPEMKNQKLSLEKYALKEIQKEVDKMMIV